jgi:type II secretory pathway pseudopilin PulG
MKTRILYVIVLVQAVLLAWTVLMCREEMAKLVDKSNRVTEARNQITTALEIYRADFGRYPTESEGLDALFAAPSKQNISWKGPYLSPENRSFLDLGLLYQNPNPLSYTLGLMLNEKK